MLLLEVLLVSAMIVQTLLHDAQIDKLCLFLGIFVHKFGLQSGRLSIKLHCLSLHEMTNVTWFRSDGLHRG